MNIQPLEILVIAIFALIVFGPRKLPDIARTVGKVLGELRRTANEFKTEFEEGFEETRPTPPDRSSPLETSKDRFPPPGPR